MAVRSLPSGDLILTTDEEATRTEWLQKTQWLQVLGGRARIKKREFIIIAHGISQPDRGLGQGEGGNIQVEP